MNSTDKVIELVSKDMLKVCEIVESVIKGKLVSYKFTFNSLVHELNSNKYLKQGDTVKILQELGIQDFKELEAKFSDDEQRFKVLIDAVDKVNDAIGSKSTSIRYNLYSNTSTDEFRYLSAILLEKICPELLTMEYTYENKYNSSYVVYNIADGKYYTEKGIHTHEIEYLSTASIEYKTFLIKEIAEMILNKYFEEITDEDYEETVAFIDRLRDEVIEEINKLGDTNE